MPGPWEKYQAQPAQDGPWTKYAQPATPTAPAAPAPTLLQTIGQSASDFGKGILKSGVSTMSAADDFAQKHLPDFMTTPIGQTPNAANSQAATDYAKQLAKPTNTSQKVGKFVGNAAQFLAPTGIESAGAELGTALGSKIAGKLAGSALNAGVINKAQGGTFGGGAAAGAVGGAIGEALPGIAKPLQGGAIDRINRVVGSLKSDFSRGANPGAGYLGANLGTSASMRSIAEKASNALDETGGRIGNALDSGTAAGVKIDPIQATQGIYAPIENARSILSGPGGANSNAIDELAETYQPMLRDAFQDGGVSPRDYFNAKLNTAKNTTWGDASNIGLKQTRQEIAGGMSGVLKDNVPELQNEFSQYQNLNKLATRAEDRASTGRPSLSGLGKNLMHVGSVAGGAATGGIGGAVLGAIPALYDSVPVQTGIASGTYKLGSVLDGSVIKALSRLTPGLVLAGNNSGVPDAPTKANKK